MQLLRGLEQLLPQLQGQIPILPSSHTQVKAASKCPKPRLVGPLLSQPCREGEAWKNGKARCSSTEAPLFFQAFSFKPFTKTERHSGSPAGE